MIAARARLLPLAIALFAVADAALVLVAAEYRPGTWNRTPRFAYIESMPASRDHAKGIVDGVFDGGRLISNGSQARAAASVKSAIDLRGWAYDAALGAPFAAMLISIDRGSVQAVPYGEARPDVAAATGCAACSGSGYSIAFQPHELAPGRHIVRLSFVTPGDAGLVSGPSVEIDVR